MHLRRLPTGRWQATVKHLGVDMDIQAIALDDLLARHRAGAKWSDLTDDEQDAFMGLITNLLEMANEAGDPCTT